MRYLEVISFLAVFAAFTSGLSAQPDNDPPLSPVLTFLTVNHETGYCELRWQKSPSPDVAGYVIYNFRNGEGFAIDTIWNPDASSYLNTGSASSYFTESYVVAAIDQARNISPLSNVLRTIFLKAEIDTCNKLISLSWNSYYGNPYTLSGYRILVSESGGPYLEAGTVSPEMTMFSIDTFRTGITYCFTAEALLETGLESGSNSSCLVTDMQRPPEWINADYATVDNNNNISLSFTCDQGSEISKFGIERKKAGENSFTRISVLENQTGKILFTDSSADPETRYFYRLAAINSCGVAIVYSNVASNIVAGVTRNGDLIEIYWTRYHDWAGGISSYSVFVNTGNYFRELGSASPSDTSFSVRYTDLMNEITGEELCFYVSASEGSNPHGIEGESNSAVICTGTLENIFVANAFTPNSDNINDLFKPVLSFTPSEYLFTISDIRNRVLFETRDHEASWDGKIQGTPLPRGVYLWFLKLKTPSGETIIRSGTVTILKNP